MKLQVGLLSVLLLSATAFGHGGFEGEWTGKGHWKGSDGTKGEWTSTETITKNKDGATIKEVTTVNLPDGKTEKMEFEWSAVATKNGFFDVKKANNKVGSGYCGRKQCHYESEDKDGNMESTVTFHHGNMYKLGSHTSKTMTVAWQGVMKKAKPAKKCGGGHCPGK